MTAAVCVTRLCPLLLAYGATAMFRCPACSLIAVSFLCRAALRTFSHLATCCVVLLVLALCRCGFLVAAFLSFFHNHYLLNSKKTYPLLSLLSCLRGGCRVLSFVLSLLFAIMLQIYGEITCAENKICFVQYY